MSVHVVVDIHTSVHAVVDMRKCEYYSTHLERQRRTVSVGVKP